MCSYVVADYMDELVDCFESFIQKSLLAIIVALAVIVASVVYLLKILSDRTLENTPSFSDGLQRPQQSRVRPRTNADTSSESRKPKKSCNECRQVSVAHSDTYDNTKKIVGLSCCSKPFCKSKSKMEGVESNTEIQINSTKYGSTPIIKQEMECDTKRKSRAISASPIRSPSPKHSLDSLAICPKEAGRASCCSMCCKEEK